MWNRNFAFVSERCDFIWAILIISNYVMWFTYITFRHKYKWLLTRISIFKNSRIALANPVSLMTYLITKVLQLRPIRILIWKLGKIVQQTSTYSAPNLKSSQKSKVVKIFISFGQQTTVWKFHKFSITHILREINFGDSKSAKSAIAFYQI